MEGVHNSDRILGRAAPEAAFGVCCWQVCQFEFWFSDDVDGVLPLELLGEA